MNDITAFESKSKIVSIDAYLKFIIIYLFHLHTIIGANIPFFIF
jgi:hypothetical protein